MAWWQFDIPGIIDDGISGANARLIAAAPELLEACEAAITATGGSSYWNGETEKFLKFCEAAVAKAYSKEAATT
jgi:hypothetical protein